MISSIKMIRNHSFKLKSHTALKSRDMNKPKKLQDQRVICSYCGSGNPAERSRCTVCWATLQHEQTLSRDEEKEHINQVKIRRQRRKRIRFLLVAIAFVIIPSVVYLISSLGQSVPLASSTINSQSTETEWLMTQKNIWHTGFASTSKFPLIQHLNESPTLTRWVFRSEGPITTSPVFADGRVYTATGDHRLAVLDEMNGNLLWEHSFKSDVTVSSLTIAGDLIFVGTHDSMLHAIDIKKEKPRWKFGLNGQTFGSPTVQNGSIYFGSTDGHLYSLDALSGELLWRSKRIFTNRTIERVTSSPALNKGIIVFGSYDEHLHIVDATSGKDRYLLDVGKSIKGAITMKNNKAYFTTWGGAIVAVDYTKKNFPLQKHIWAIWQQLAIWELAPLPPHPPGVLWVRGGEGTVNGNLATAGNLLFIATETGNLSALNTDTGEPLWTITGLGTLRPSPIIGGTTLIQCSLEGNVYGIDIDSGKKLWEFKLDTGVFASPILVNDTLYIPTIDGSLYAFK